MDEVRPGEDPGQRPLPGNMLVIVPPQAKPKPDEEGL